MNDLTDHLNKMKELVDIAIVDAKKFDNRDRVAGVRVRKTMQNVKKTAQWIREMVQKEAKRR